MLLLAAAILSPTLPQLVVFSNGKSQLAIDRISGRFNLSFGGIRLGGLYGEAKLSDGKLVKTTSYPKHFIDAPKRVRDQFGLATRVTAHFVGRGKPELRQTFWLYPRGEVFVQLSIVGKTKLSSNYLAPIVGRTPLSIPHAGPLHSLFVPYDNDSYVRFSSENWSPKSSPDSKPSFEVGAVYDDATRKGLVIGSIDHHVWKSGVAFAQQGGLKAFSGVVSKKFTHDGQPHGAVTGRTISSARFLVGWYPDWRAGMERYGAVNAMVSPALKWNGSAPFGWSSWSGHKDHVKAKDGRAATDFVKYKMPWFRQDGTAYINLDSFWDNFTNTHLKQFAIHAHALGLKAGIYYTPFTIWGKLSDRVVGTKYHYRDLVLRDAKGQPLKRLDGGYPIDPTHPGSVLRIHKELSFFMQMGYDLVKLDFLTHGAVEGKHYDPKIQTGNEAYEYGMSHLIHDPAITKAEHPVFFSLSIAPLFPNGYGHSRRVSCDIFANIGATEYLLNSSNYGWWIGNRVYQINDADSSSVYQPLGEPAVTEEESRSRATASAITGGVMILGDDMKKKAQQTRVLQIFSNRALLNLARKSVSFRPIYGDTGDKAGDRFVWADPNGKTVYVAIFNFDKKQSQTKSIPLKRITLPRGKRLKVIELWTGKSWTLGKDMTVTLAPMDCALLRIGSAN